MTVEVLEARDLPAISPLQPDGWLPILSYYAYYLMSDRCFPVKYTERGKIIGIGALILHQETAWIAHIIVDSTKRRKGIGTLITSALMKCAETKSCKTISLVSTPLGKPVYEKLGFVPDTAYTFLRGPKIRTSTWLNLRLIDRSILPSIIKLDRQISGEDRSALVNAHWKKAVYALDKNLVTGYYLPTLGEGFIGAVDFQTGVRLMAVKHAARTLAVIPEQNDEAISFLETHGYSPFRQGFRMYKGERLSWSPRNIFGRIGGNLG